MNINVPEPFLLPPRPFYGFPQGLPPSLPEGLSQSQSLSQGLPQFLQPDLMSKDPSECLSKDLSQRLQHGLSQRLLQGFPKRLSQGPSRFPQGLSRLPQGFSPHLTRCLPRGISPHLTRGPPRGFSHLTRGPPRGFSHLTRGPPRGFSHLTRGPPRGFSHHPRGLPLHLQRGPPQGFAVRLVRGPPRGLSPYHPPSLPPYHSPSLPQYHPLELSPYHPRGLPQYYPRGLPQYHPRGLSRLPQDIPQFLSRPTPLGFPQGPPKGPPCEDKKSITRDVTSTRGILFEDYKLKKELLMGIFAKGWDLPSPIQEQCIPVIMKRRNLLARAKNGTGKTGAYAIPVLQMIDLSKPMLQALVIVPTRELALQVSATFNSLAKYMKLVIRVATGGCPLRDDIRMLHHRVQSHIIVATPGRFLSLIENDQSKVSDCKLIVLDEADRMVCSDFAKVLTQVIDKMPEERQVVLFSATYPNDIQTFIDLNLPDPFEIDSMMHEFTLVGVTQYYVDLPENIKVQCLIYIMANLRINQCLIFVNSSNRAELLSQKLNEEGYCCFYSHAQLLSPQRDLIFKNFKKGIIRNLVCSDMYCRGIDIEGLNVVINFDFPRLAVRYLHRIGRSGRFGRHGLAISFITPSDTRYFEIVQYQLKTRIQPMPRDINPELYADNLHLKQ